VARKRPAERIGRIQSQVAFSFEGTRHGDGAASGSAVEDELDPRGDGCRGVEDVGGGHSLKRRGRTSTTRADGSRRVDPLIAVEGAFGQGVARSGHVWTFGVGIAAPRPAEADPPTADFHPKELKTVDHDVQGRRGAPADVDRRWELTADPGGAVRGDREV